jgi:glycine cleavage system aminomethyltransferase T
VKLRGFDVHVLRHGMAGHEGLELSGAYEDGPAVRAAILEAGRKWGLRQGGTRTYFSTVGEEGWLPYPLPAIYTGEAMRKFREWLPANSWESRSQLGGSFRSSNIEDYYVTPYDYGLDRLMKFDHDFVGRQALERLAHQPRRTKVTLVWNKDDVAKVRDSWFEPGTPYKYMEMPVSYYAFQHADEVRSPDGRLIGLSAFVGYTVNERETLSLAMVDLAEAAPGTEVVVTWGEPDGGSRKPHVERHRQVEIRATVAPTPYAKAVQEFKRRSHA